MEENFLTATEELIEITAKKITASINEHDNFIPVDELNALAALITARATHTQYVRAFASSRDLV